jgi:hypothetical protein
MGVQIYRGSTLNTGNKENKLKKTIFTRWDLGGFVKL